MLFYSGELSEQQRVQALDYLIEKWNATLTDIAVS
jgi:hypothetical protein